MKINSVECDNNRYSISITFNNEHEERKFLIQIVNLFRENFRMNCMILDLDVCYECYKSYFSNEHCYTIDDITRAFIFAYDVTYNEVETVISNWGYYTLDAAIAFGDVDLAEQNDHSAERLKSMPIYIQQILDYSLFIVIDEQYYKSFMTLLN